MSYPDFTNLKRPKYEISNHLGSGGGATLNHDLLKTDINADATINTTRTCQSVSTHDDILTIRFDDNLTNPTQTNALTSVLSAYVYSAPVSDKVVNASTTVITTSGVYIPINGMSITPTAGSYVVMFSATASHSKDKKDSQYAIFVDDTIVQNSERDFGWDGGADFKNCRITIYTQAEVTVDGTQTIYVCWHDGGDGEFSCYERNLIVI